MAEVMGAEAAIVRIQFVSGTHAISTALFAVLRYASSSSLTCPPSAASMPHAAFPKGACITMHQLKGGGSIQSQRLPNEQRTEKGSLMGAGQGMSCWRWLEKPYDTLEEVIGLRGTPGHGSLKEWGVAYRELPLARDGAIDWDALASAINPGEER